MLHRCGMEKTTRNGHKPVRGCQSVTQLATQFLTFGSPGWRLLAPASVRPSPASTDLGADVVQGRGWSPFLACRGWQSVCVEWLPFFRMCRRGGGLVCLQESGHHFHTFLSMCSGVRRWPPFCRMLNIAKHPSRRKGHQRQLDPPHHGQLPWGNETCE